MWCFSGFALLGVSSTAHAASVGFRPIAKGDRWPRVELKREIGDKPGPMTAHIFLKQVTNPSIKFGPYLNEKEVGVLVFKGRGPAAVQPLDGAVTVPSSGLLAGRYELRVRVDTQDGTMAAAAVATLDETRIALISGASSLGVRTRASAGARSDETSAAASPNANPDPKLVHLDAREMAALPTDEARRAAQVFAFVLTTRDAESFRQLVAQDGLQTDKGRLSHTELGKQVPKGLDPFLGPPPRAPWHVVFARDTPNRFSMKPSKTGDDEVSFRKGSDNRWRIEQVSRKKSTPEQ